MANIYVRSTDGDNADNGSTWALAKATLTGAAAIDAAGDRIFLSQAHSESTASAVTVALAGTLASPTQILCGDDAAEPPTALATTAKVATTGASTITLNGGHFYCYGVQFEAGSAGSGASIALATTDNTAAAMESCALRITNTNTGSTVQLGGVGSTAQRAAISLKNVTFKFGAANQRIIAGYAKIRISGGSIESGGSTPTNLFVFGGYSNDLEVVSFDFSNLSSSFNLTSGGVGGRAIFRNCKLPSGWSGSLAAGTLFPSFRAELHNCDSADTNYRLLIADYLGTIRSETTIVRSGGASDGTTAFSWAMVSGANAEYPLLALYSPEFSVWNDTTGSSITVTVEIVTDGVTLNDDECWLEVQYLGTSGFPLGSIITDAKSDVLASAAAQTSSSETWTTTGLASPVKQKLSVTFTPQEKGYLQACVKLAKASTTVYVDPMLTVT